MSSNPDSTAYLLQSTGVINNLGNLADQRLEREKPYALYQIAPVLNSIFSHLNHLTILGCSDLGLEPFEVVLTEAEEGRFVRRVFHAPNVPEANLVANFSERESEDLPVFNMEIKISHTFNIVRDLPDLVVTVQNLHNQQINAYPNSEAMSFINTSKQLSEYWKFLSVKLGEFSKINRIKIYAIGKQNDNSLTLGETLLAPTLETYAQVCDTLASGFASVDSVPTATMAPAIDNSPWFELNWQQTEKRLNTILEGLTNVDSQYQARLLQNPERFLQLLTHVAGGEAQRKMLEEMNTQARDVFFHHCEAELWRKAGLGHVWDKLESTDDVGDVWFASGISQSCVDFLRSSFPREKSELDSLRDELIANRSQLETNNDSNSRVLLTSIRTLLQKQLASSLLSLVYSQKMFVYLSGSYSFANAIEENQVNCMVRAELLHQWYGYYAGETTFSGLANEHIYSVIKLADDSYLSFDSLDEPIPNDSPKILDIGDHQRLYQAGIMNWRADELLNQGNVIVAEALYREAIRLAPNHSNYKYNLALLLKKDHIRVLEAEELFREVVKLDPKNPKYKNSLAKLICGDPNSIQEAEKLYREAMDLDPKNPNIKLNLAILLQNDSKSIQEAEKLYREAMNLDPKNPNIKLNLAILLKKDPNRIKEAETLLREAVELDQTDHWIVASLASFYHESLRFNDAIIQYRSVLQLMKKFPEKPNWLSEESVKLRIKACKRKMSLIG